MRTFCPTCETGYTIPDDRIGPKGRKVRCTKCGEEWRVLPGGATEPVEATAEPPRAAPEPKPAPKPEPAPVAREPAVAAPPPPPEPKAPPGAPPVAPPIASPAAAEPTFETIADSVDAETSPEPAPESVPPARILPNIRIRTKSRLPKLRLPRLSLRLFDGVAVRTRLIPFFGPLVFVSACITVAALIGFRTSIVAAHPDLAGLYATIGFDVNLRGLAFGRIETLREVENGQTVLVVEGSVVNTTRDTRDVPALRFALRAGDTQELYAWSIAPKTTALAAGDSFRFRTRLAAPPEQAADVQVRFVERRNLQAGLP